MSGGEPAVADVEVVAAEASREPTDDAIGAKNGSSSGGGVSAVEMDALRSRLRRCDEAKRLDFSGRGLADEVRSLAEELRTNSCLLHLDLSNNDIDDAAFLDLIAAVRANHALRSLNVAGNARITSACVSALLDLPAANNVVHTIDLSGTRVSEADRNAVEERLSLNSFPEQFKRCILMLETDAYPPNDLCISLTYDLFDPKVSTVRTVERLARALQGRRVVSFSCCRCVKDLDVSPLVAAIANDALETAVFREAGIEPHDVAVAFVGLIAAAPSLRHLDLTDNHVGDEGVRLLTRAIEGSDSLERVSIDGNDVSPPYLARLRAATSLNTLPRVLKATLPLVLRDDPSLTELCIRGGAHEGRGVGRSFLNNAAAHVVSEALQRNTHVTAVDLSGNQIGPEGCLPLAALVQESRTLQTLKLSGNAIGDDGARRLLQALAESESVTALDLDGCAVSQKLLAEAASLCRANTLPRALKRMLPSLWAGSACDKSLTELDFSESGQRLLGEGGTAVLCNVLKDNRYVTALNLSSNKIGDEGAVHLARYMQDNNAIKSLKLCDNGIGPEGGAALLRALRFNNSVTYMNLSANQAIPYTLRDDIDVAVELNLLEPVMKEIVTRLSSSDRTLTEVDLSIGEQQSKLTDDLTRTLADVLIGNRQVTTINLDGNSVSSTGAAYICEWMRTAEGPLRTLSLCANELNHDAAGYLRDALTQPDSPQLATLLLRDNAIGPQGGAAILELVRAKKSLVCVDVAGNGVPAEIEQAIRHVCRLNQHSDALKQTILGLMDNDADVTEVDVSGLCSRDILEAVVSGVRTSTHVVKLAARACGLDATGCAAIAAGIRGHPSLRELDLSENPTLDDFDVGTLADVIEVSGCAVRRVCIDGSSATPAACTRLEHATRLASLPPTAARALLAARQNSTHATSLCFADAGECDGDTVCALLRYCLRDNESVVSIDVSGLGVTDQGATALAVIMRASTRLSHVSLANNPITVTGLQEVFTGVWESSTLRELNIDGLLAFEDTGSDEDGRLLAVALRDRLLGKLEENRRLAGSDPHTAMGNPGRRLITMQLDHYRSKDYVDRVQKDIMQEALAGYTRVAGVS
eukprot:Rhum_TRINITY_DN2794_c0_g1::Rhum_TRINITY_DN2794_c0_g1_i1::g.8330::m.8330